MAIYEIALQNGQKMPLLRIDGPYGAPAEDVLDNEIAILIGMGIGVTPWASVLKNIWHLRNERNSPIRLRRVEFIWICKDTSAFEWFHQLLSSLEDPTAEEAAASPESSSQKFLRIHTYLTQKLDDDMAQNVVLNSVGSKVDPLTKLKTSTNFGPTFPSYSSMCVIRLMMEHTFLDSKGLCRLQLKCTFVDHQWPVSIMIPSFHY